jgi:signal transduction histidine kinase/ActR/RegA family two-component response regulator
MATTAGPTHVVEQVNAAFCRLVGREREALMGRPFGEGVRSAAHDGSLSLLEHVYLTGKSRTSGRRKPHVGSDGSYWSYTAWAILGAEQRPAGAMIQATDVTDAVLMRVRFERANDEMREISEQLLLSSLRKDELAEQAAAAEEQLLQARKMEGIGRLAGGVAHDFNNILTAILGYADLAEGSAASDADVQPHLQGIRRAAERAATLTGQILAFARKQISDPKITNVNTLVRDIDGMLRRLVGAPVELAFLPEPDLGNVKLDPGQFGQVLMNLVVNARDAMPSGGRITIQTANVTLDEVAARRRGDVAPGDYVRLSVSDTGVGMAEETKAHVFEPFFTTKEQGKGTGLGLATCHGIVKQSGGHVRLTSTLGVGTSVEIYLPRVEAEPIPVPISESASLPRGAERILLVDDEPMILDIAALVLRKQGYTVVGAPDGEEALRLFHADPGAIDLVVTDMLMPKMGGKALADRLHATRPRLPVLYTSGHAEDGIVSQGVLAPGLAFLRKPFGPATLARKVREVLDEAARGTPPRAQDQAGSA